MATTQPDMVWAEVLRQLSKTMSPSTFSTFVKPLTLAKVEVVGEARAIAYFSAQSPYVSQQAELRCYAQLKQAIDLATGLLCDLVFNALGEGTPPELIEADNFDFVNRVPPSAFSSQEKKETPKRKVAPLLDGAQSLFSPSAVVMPTVDRYKLAAQKAHLREDFNFDTFAVSGSNEMAYAASQAVAKSPGQVYNPLFLWGGVGVGKTHIMQSIGNVILKANPDTPLLYCMGEEFLNEIISAIRTKRTMEFKEKYRQLKVLLIDDIQFIAGKDTAQEEFFHTFNAITRAGGQVIMTSDRPPHEIHPLEDRLRSRFEGGLTIDIQQPTFELRTAILLIKAQKRGLELGMDLAQIIAAEVESTRKLEGVIFKLHSAHFYQNQPLTPDLVRRVLGEESRPIISKKKVKPSMILRAVTSHFHVSANTLRSGSRKKEYVTARHIAMYLMKIELDIPYTEIGASFGGRDHTSVMHAVQKIERELADNSQISQAVSAIRVSLSAL